MLKVLSDESSIRRYERQFARGLKMAARETVPVTIGHPGASERAKILWSERLGIWFFCRKIAGSRYWNAFGVGRPEGGGAVAITCEINFPLCGIDRRTGGAFAQDRDGRIYVVHRGKLGGGRKGIGKSLFASHYRGLWEEMDDDGGTTAVAVVASLQSPRFARQIAQFVTKIARIKETAAAPSAQTEMSFDELALREELIGDPYPKPTPGNGARCDHGLIVRDLARIARERGFRTGNDGRRDLLIMDRSDRIRVLFQVLSKTDLPELCTGAARLLLEGTDLPGNPLLVLVLPEMPDQALQDKLLRLNVDLLTCRWSGEEALFPDLDALLSRIGT
jgi:hypothetical protein